MFCERMEANVQKKENCTVDKKSDVAQICEKICFLADDLRDILWHSKFRRQYHKIMSLTLSQQRMLQMVWRMTINNSQGVMLKELAKALFLSNSAVSVMVENLVKRGCLERIPGEDDRRKVFIRLSDTGRRYTAESESFLGELSERFFSGVAGDKKRVFIRVLNEFQQFLVENKK